MLTLKGRLQRRHDVLRKYLTYPRTLNPDFLRSSKAVLYNQEDIQGNFFRNLDEGELKLLEEKEEAIQI